ncbi:MAG: nucleotide sugar dehydrogenase [Kiritimatiellia bacterium]
MSEERIVVLGLGYVGLPLALGLAKAFPDVLGFDIHVRKVESLRAGEDPAAEIDSQELKSSTLRFSSDPQDLKDRTFFIIAVPTPVDRARKPDLHPVRAAAEVAGRAMRPGALVVLESTVYPGVTEEFMGPVLARASGLVQGHDFKLGYSPERINPGDKEHTLARVIKVVAGQDAEALARVCAVYEKVALAGLHRASSIKVAEAAKVIENTQRDLNIALMNELSLIFDRIGISTSEVLAAAGTKWNFLPFRPGLVGGHCIGVDPYYLTWKAEELGYHPQVILSGRRINDSMGAWIAQKTAKLLACQKRCICGAQIGVLGLSFKEDVKDLRNSRVPDIIAELKEFGAECHVHDPLGDPAEAWEEYGIRLSDREGWGALDAVILAVAHKPYLQLPMGELLAGLQEGGVVVDVKSALDPRAIPAGCLYWRL